MNEGPPLAIVEELITRWTLAKLPMAIMEGPFDERLLRLMQRESYCDAALRDLDVRVVDSIETPVALLNKHGITGGGAKYRVVAIAREMEAQACADGFRGIVDKDLDPFLAIDLRSPALLYTDHCCMDTYLWTLEVLRRMITQFRCEQKIHTVKELKSLFVSIGAACADLCAARLTGAIHPEWELSLHNSDKALSIVGKGIRLDLPKYVEQCKPVKGALADAKAFAIETREKLATIDHLELINGHDLTWLLTYVFRTFTKGTRRAVDAEIVASSLAAFGVMNEKLLEHPMFKALITWRHAVK